MSIHQITTKIHLIDAPYLGKYGTLSNYLIRGEKSAIIDPGPASSAPGVLAALKVAGVKKLDYILLSHIHLDHAAGCWKILETYPEAVIYLHPRGTRHMIDPTKIKAAAYAIFGESINDYGEIKGVPAEKLVDSKDNETIDLDGIELQVIWTPGHSSHSLSYFEPESGVVFVGDAGGHSSHVEDYYIPTSPPPHNPVKSVQSVDRLIALCPKILCISHIGFKKDAVEELETYNRLVKHWEQIAVTGVDEGLKLRDIVERLSQEDPNAKLLWDMDGEARRSLFSSMIGFVEYAKWLKKKG